jgi:hypothetical protein
MHSLTRSTRGGRGGTLELRDGTRKSDKLLITLSQIFIQPTISSLVHIREHLGGKTSHERFWTHKTHHGPDLGEATTFPHIVFSASLHGTYIWMAFCFGTPLELFRFGLPPLCELITFCSDLWLGWGLKQTCSSCQELFNGVLHFTWTHRGRVDSWLLVVRSQIASFTPGLSFCHNLCCKSSNGSCEPIFDI